MPPSELDSIQKKLVELGNHLRPDYHPVVEPCIYQGKHILILWCPGGSTRPYKAPKSLPSKGAKKEPIVHEYYIRRNSTTLIANEKAIRILYERANQIPFDDQINHGASLEEFSLGLMMFNDKPEIFFPYTQIEVVEYRDAEGDSFSEKIFKGPIHKQLSESLRYIESLYIREEVRKVPGQAAAQRFYNYPFAAVEEALANAIYHRDYQKREPVEVRIHPDRIEIQSFPGPLPPITVEELNQGRQIKVREYRNRRIGDFLKELHLTEGRCTGIPKIRRSMRDNGSPEALFETDDDRTYFLTTLPIHSLLVGPKSIESTQPEPKSTQSKSKSTQPEPKSTQSKPKSAQSTTSSAQPESGTKERLIDTLPRSLQQRLETLKPHERKTILRPLIVDLCAIQPLSAGALADLLGRKSRKALVRDHLTPLKAEGSLQVVNPKENAANQTYQATRQKYEGNE